jgi:hypothetical protein
MGNDIQIIGYVQSVFELLVGILVFENSGGGKEKSLASRFKTPKRKTPNFTIKS